MAKMGFQFGLEREVDLCFKRKFRWMFHIPKVCCEQNALPPSRSARPNLSFKESQVEHVTETVFLPGKPDWKPIAVTLYDIRKGNNAAFDWIKKIYDPESGQWTPPGDTNFFRECVLTMYSGCGQPLESWVYENVWPQQADFADLSMNDSELATIELTLRYARAYIVSPREIT